MAKKSIRLYEAEIATLLSLPETQRGKILTALLATCVGTEIPELDAMEMAVYTLVNGQVQRAEELSNKRKQAVESRWGKDSNPDSNNTTAIQNDTNAESEDTNAYTITITNTGTNTDTTTDTDITPPNPPAGGRDRKAEIMEIWESYTFSPELERAVRDWGRYKKEKRQGYKPEGLKNLLSTIRNRADEHGDATIIALIRESMAANYTGITWGKLVQTGGAAHGRAEIAGGNNQQQGFNPAGLAGFRNALDRYDDEGNEIGADGD